MKKVKNRAMATLIIAAMFLAGLGVYIARYAADGEKWAMFAANAAVYTNGRLAVGALTDRNGAALAGISGGARAYADDEVVRRATLHVVGDPNGNIGTGALTAFAPELVGYNLLTGAYSRTGTGKTVALTIDARLNAAAYRALDGRRGAVVVLNYETGEILCMVSSPTFDPASPPVIEDGDPKYEGVYINRASSSAYAPGSTFKLVTAAAAIEHIGDIFDRVFICDGSVEIGGETVTCTKKHGEVTFEDALAASCNAAFAQITVELGADALTRYVDACGVAARGDINGISVAAGKFDKAEDGTADLAWSGIGQYNDLVTPVSMARFAGVIANGGEQTALRLLKKNSLSAGVSRVMKKETAEKLASMMSYNVHLTYGEENYPGLALCAKSGTAEVGGGAPPHAWFTGFITNENHPLTFAVIVETGGAGSAVAGAVANAVLQAAITVER
jgi:peptidoglycan glycosyltransferase